MNSNDLGNTIDLLYRDYLDALVRKANVAQTKETLTNVMLNNAGLIAEALIMIDEEDKNLKEIAKLKQTNAELTDDLLEAQSENDRLECELNDVLNRSVESLTTELDGV